MALENISTTIISSIPSYVSSVLHVIIALLIILIVYVAIGKVLSSLRSRGAISRRVESWIKLLVLVVAILIVFPIVLSSYIQQSYWFSIAILVITFTILLLSLKTYLENIFSYLIIVTSGIVRDGENIQIVFGGYSYEGKANLLEGNFMQIITEDNKAIYIPYKHLLSAVIIKSQQYMLKMKVHFYGHNIDIEKIGNVIVNTLQKMRVTVYDIKPVEIHGEKVTFLIETSIRDSKDATHILSNICRKLSTELPHRFEIEVT